MAGRFELVKKGYCPDAVDRYVQSLEAQVAGYRDKDKAITGAIISAQHAADNIVTNAKVQARIVRENTSKQLADISLSLNTQRRMLSDFASEYGVVVSKYLKAVDNADFIGITEKIDSLETYLADFADEVAEDLEVEYRMQENSHAAAISELLGG